ncbi:uncharacterized protein LOC142796223 [Rhipicephalus microplus]|uniref:uncharacterized protein LOC142796223 n=1 Tax=Rhipicephalus microplus TaxID=6941 RepID=UPI003F6ABBAC
MAAARIQRWALQLGAYRYQLQYAPGRQMLNADALSRLPLQTTETDEDALTGSKEDQEDWLPLPGSDVYARNYGVGSKWTPGNVKATSGARMVTVNTPDGVVQRHVDQLRPRQDSPPVTTATSPSESDQATEPSPPEAVSSNAGMSSRLIPNDAGSAQRASPKITAVPMSTGVAQQALRRSTRERKTVQRFQF